jgi:phosphohistidine phosphatase
MDLIMSSDAERAKSTTVLISNALQYPLHQILFTEKIYSGTLNDLLAILKDIPDTIHHVMMVGHFPAILELNNLLSDSVKAGLSTCELIVLEFTEPWTDITSGSGKRILNYYPTIHNE